MFAWRKKKHLSGDINVCININVWREDSLVMSVELLVVYIGNVHIQCEVLKKKKKRTRMHHMGLHVKSLFYWIYITLYK